MLMIFGKLIVILGVIIGCALIAIDNGVKTSLGVFIVAMAILGELELLFNKLMKSKIHW